MQRCVAVREVPERCLTNYNLAVSALCRAHRAVATSKLECSTSIINRAGRLEALNSAFFKEYCAFATDRVPGLKRSLQLPPQH